MGVGATTHDAEVSRAPNFSDNINLCSIGWVHLHGSHLSATYLGTELNATDHGTKLSKKDLGAKVAIQSLQPFPQPEFPICSSSPHVFLPPQTRPT